MEKKVKSNKKSLFFNSIINFFIFFIKRRIAQLVERWFPKPKDKGSSPFFPVFFICVIFKFV